MIRRGNHKKMFKNIGIAMMSLFFLLLPVSGYGTDLLRERINSYGYIDWLSYTAYAKGVGIAPTDKQNTVQAKPLAYRAAVVVAQRNLLEVIKGVHIDSETLLEDRIVTDEKIVSKIEGVIKFCQVEESRLLNGNTVEVIVSMPLIGRLGEVLIRLIQKSEGRQRRRLSPLDLESRLQHLEDRVQVLEDQLAMLKKVTHDQEVIRQLLVYLADAWQRNSENTLHLRRAGFASDTETQALRKQIDDQERRLSVLADKLLTLSKRLDRIETGSDDESIDLKTQTLKKPIPYTGLIVDARETGFKPCLKPELFSKGELIYPGDYIDISRAVKTGYVRYYHTRIQAERSQRIGPLPYVVSAMGTYQGSRSLALGEDTYKILKTVLQHADNFLAQGKVVIILGSSTAKSND